MKDMGVIKRCCRFAIALGLLTASARAFSLSRAHDPVVLNAQTHDTCADHASAPIDTPLYTERRRFVGDALQGLSISASGLFTGTAVRANAAATSTATTTSSSPPKVTKKAFMEVRISRSDGTFYVRDDLPDTPENRVFQGRLTLELFGEAAPTAVEQFTRYIDVAYNPLEDNPLPSYSRSSFKRLDQATGLLAGGEIPGLELTSFAGSTALQYGGRILTAPLWIKSGEQRVSHTGKGLLTHRALDVSPAFGITTRAAPDELDPTHVVFGRLVLDNVGSEFLNLCQDIPTYSIDRPRGDPSAVDDVASAVFNSQREFFRSAAKSFGDDRLSKVYEGKLLRRVEVTKVGML